MFNFVVAAVARGFEVSRVCALQLFQLRFSYFTEALLVVVRSGGGEAFLYNLINKYQSSSGPVSLGCDRSYHLPTQVFDDPHWQEAIGKACYVL